MDAILAGMGSIEVEALTYILGRRIPGQFIIIDEAQNLLKLSENDCLRELGKEVKSF